MEKMVSNYFVSSTLETIHKIFGGPKVPWKNHNTSNGGPITAPVGGARVLKQNSEKS